MVVMKFTCLQFIIFNLYSFIAPSASSIQELVAKLVNSKPPSPVDAPHSSRTSKSSKSTRASKSSTDSSSSQYYLVGQSLEKDLDVLNLLGKVSENRIRDTAGFFKRFHPKGKTPGLRDLAKWNLGIDIQDGEHDSVSFISMKFFQILIQFCSFMHINIYVIPDY